MRLLRDEAVILRHIDYGESDRIVTFLAAGHGLLKGFARSARKSRRRFGPALETFARVRLHWAAPTSGELVRLREAELLELRTGLRRSLPAMALAGYGCELVETLLPGDPDPGRAFRLLDGFLDHLAVAEGGEADARLLLELRVLALSGYLPHLLHCAGCGGELPAGPVAFDPGQGGSLCPGCAAGGGELRIDRMTLGSLGRLLRLELGRYREVRLGSQSLAEGTALTALALRWHLPRPLKSQRFLEEVGDGTP